MYLLIFFGQIVQFSADLFPCHKVSGFHQFLHHALVDVRVFFFFAERSAVKFSSHNSNGSIELFFIVSCCGGIAYVWS